MRSASVIASRPCLLAAYHPTNGSVTRPEIEEMLMIRPRRRWRIVGSTSRAIRAGAIRLTSSCARIASSVTSSIAPGWANPALFTTAHGPPSVIVAISVNARTVDMASATSQHTCLTLTPAAPAASCRSCAADSSRAVPITSYPDSASPTATARPIPLVAPVTTTLFPIRPILARRLDAAPTVVSATMTAASSAAELPVRHRDAPAPGEPIGSHYHRCFGCGDDHRTGLHMHVSAGAGLSIDAKFTVTEDHQGAPGLAHGGLLTAAFDEALGSLAWLLRKPMVTVRLETEFRSPVPVGTTLYIRAVAEKVVGRRIYTRAEGRIGEPSGPVAVRAAAVFVTVPIEHFVKYGPAEDVAAALERDDLRAVARRAFDVNP